MLSYPHSPADFIEAEGSRRSFRTLSVAERLAHAGVPTELAVELADQALGLAQAATDCIPHSPTP